MAGELSCALRKLDIARDDRRRDLMLGWAFAVAFVLALALMLGSTFMLSVVIPMGPLEGMRTLWSVIAGLGWGGMVFGAFGMVANFSTMGDHHKEIRELTYAYQDALERHIQ